MHILALINTLSNSRILVQNLQKNKLRKMIFVKKPKKFLQHLTDEKEQY